MPFKIMVVEDSPATLKQYKDDTRAKYDIDFFEDARTAFLNYKTDKYDLVITDLMLPLKSGEGLIFDIKYSNPKQKIAVISGSPHSLQLDNYDNIQVFEKPVNICDIIDCILSGKPVRNHGLYNNKRRHPRFRVDMHATLLIPGLNLKIPVHVGNVSLGGVFIDGKLPDSLLDEANTLPIELSIFDKPLRINLEKRWHVDGVGFGAKFQNLDHSEYSLLELFLESLRADGGH